MQKQMDWSEYSTESKLCLPLHMRLLFKLDKVLRSKTMHNDGSINRCFSDLLEYKASARPSPRHGVSSKDVVIDAETGVWVRIYAPPHKIPNTTEEMKGLPIVFYFHGGGFAALCANFTYYNSFCKRLCRACNVIVISVDYRRSPEYRYPTAYEDCFSSLKWARSDLGARHIPSNADTSACFLMGDSAGGNIVHHVACMVANSVEELSPLQIKGSFLLFPFFGGEERTPAEIRMPEVPLGTLKEADWYWKAYLPIGANRDHHAANVVGPNALDYTKLALPPCMVVVAEHDFLKDWQLKYVERLKESGKDVQLQYYRRGIHSFHVFKQMDLASHLMTKLDTFIKAACASTRGEDLSHKQEVMHGPNHNHHATQEDMQ